MQDKKSNEHHPSDYNNVSKDRLEEARTMFPYHKGLLTFRLLNGTRMSLPDPDKSDKNIVQMAEYEMYPMTLIPYTDTIKDKNDKVVDIAMIASSTANVVQFEHLFVQPNSKGYFSISEKKMGDAKKRDFLLLSNRFKDNPWRDESVEPLYTLVDEVKKAKHSHQVRMNKAEAFIFLKNMKEAQKRDFAAAMGWDDNDDEGVLDDKIGLMIDKDAADFIKTAENPDLQYRSVLKRAMDKKIVTFSPEENKLTVDGGVEIALERVYNTSMYDQFVAFVNNNGNRGSEIFNTIKNLLYPKTKK